MKESRLYDAQAEALYMEHERRTAWINEHDWKITAPKRRAPRAAVAGALRALANRIAPPQAEAGQPTRALADGGAR